MPFKSPRALPDTPELAAFIAANFVSAHDGSVSEAACAALRPAGEQDRHEEHDQRNPAKDP